MAHQKLIRVPILALEFARPSGCVFASSPTAVGFKLPETKQDHKEWLVLLPL